MRAPEAVVVTGQAGEDRLGASWGVVADRERNRVGERRAGGHQLIARRTVECGVGGIVVEELRDPLDGLVEDVVGSDFETIGQRLFEGIFGRAATAADEEFAVRRSEFVQLVAVTRDLEVFIAVDAAEDLAVVAGELEREAGAYWVVAPVVLLGEQREAVGAACAGWCTGAH